MRVPFVITFHQWCGRDFLQTETRLTQLSRPMQAKTWKIWTRDFSRLGLHRSRKQILETETLEFRSRAATSFWNKTARFYAKNSVSVGICNLGRLIDFFSFYSLLQLYCQKCWICRIRRIGFHFWLQYSRRNEVLKGIFTEIIVVSQSVCEIANLFNL